MAHDSINLAMIQVFESNCLDRDTNERLSHTTFFIRCAQLVALDNLAERQQQQAQEQAPPAAQAQPPALAQPPDFSLSPSSSNIPHSSSSSSSNSSSFSSTNSEDAQRAPIEAPVIGPTIVLVPPIEAPVIGPRIVLMPPFEAPVTVANPQESGEFVTPHDDNIIDVD